MLDSNLHGDPGSNAIAEEVGLLNPDVREQRDGILSHLPIGEGPINVGSVPVSLLLDGNDLSSSGKARQDLSERGADGRQTAVKQDQWEACAMHLVIHLKAVNLCVEALATLVHCICVLGRALCHAYFSL